MHSKQLKHFKPLNPDSSGSCNGGGERKGVGGLCGGVLRESDGVGGGSVGENTGVVEALPHWDMTNAICPEHSALC